MAVIIRTPLEIKQWLSNWYDTHPDGYTEFSPLDYTDEYVMKFAQAAVDGEMHISEEMAEFISWLIIEKE